MAKNMPSKVKDRVPKNAPIDFEEIKEGKDYLMKIANPDTGEVVEKKVKVTGKRENETTDGTPGAKILTYQHEGF